MSEPLPILEPGLQIGDYVLNQLVKTAPDYQTWLGEQISVKREVELVCYYGPEPDQFVADIREKVLVENGTLGLVYEAIPTDQFIAFAREVLPHRSLETLRTEGKFLLPLEVTRIISQVAATIKTLDKKGIARHPFDLSDVRLDEQNRVRLHNIAKAGPIEDDSSSRIAFADGLRELLQFGQPGATRMGTLLDYIKGTEAQRPIPWSQAETLASQVEAQLSAGPVPPPRSAPILESKKGGKGVMAAGLICGLVAIVIGVFVFRPKAPKIQTGLIVNIPEGRYPRPNGGLVELEGFRIDATEVTIREYSEFMMAWQDMKAEERKELWPQEFANEKVSVRPEGWNDYFPIARASGSWNGRKMSLDHPVVGVDWWDARAFAKWCGGRLPTEMEWWAAASSGLAASTQPVEWAPVGGTEELIYGLRGNVAEWSHKASRNPAFPIESPQVVILGGSFLDPNSKALSRKWVESPGFRAEDLGFRVVYPVEQ